MHEPDATNARCCCSAALTMDLADLARGIRNVAVNTQDTRLARGGQATAFSDSHHLHVYAPPTAITLDSATCACSDESRMLHRCTSTASTVEAGTSGHKSIYGRVLLAASSPIPWVTYR
jgi:hypothetical protein